jgi:hypothetical protein
MAALIWDRLGRRHGVPRGAAETLRLPPGCTARWLGDPDAQAELSGWVKSSPDHTVYHLAPYIDFLRAQGACADVLLVAREGNPLFALPIHSFAAAGIDCGYSGVVFPATGREGPLRRAVAALVALFECNRHIPFQAIQSAQAPAYDDAARTNMLRMLLEAEGLELERVYTRLCDLDRLPAPEQVPLAPGRHPGALAIDGDWLGGESLDGYDPDVRNQIRQALRRGLSVEYANPDDATARANAYERFQPVHESSWARTGLLPKPRDYWPALSAAVTEGGGEDLVVLVLDGDGEALAGVVCHAYGERAIYWSGCSTARGLRLRANPLCLHGAIAACRHRGVRTFELGRFRADEPSSKERRVSHYKAQFGGSLVPVTAFSSTPSLAARARAARAGALGEGRRRLAVEIARARVRRRDGAR